MPAPSSTPRNAQTKSPIIKNLTGGLNVREAITDIADNEGAAVSNVVFYTAGALSRRGAWKKLIANSPTANPLLGVYQAVFNNAGVFAYYLVVTDGADIWQTSNPTANPVVWTKITGSAALDATQPFRFLQMAGKLIIFNGKCAFYWSGYTYASLALEDANNADLLHIMAVTAGTGGNATTVAVAAGTASGKKITVVNGGTTETYDNQASVAAAVAAINGQSALVTATFVNEGTLANIAATNLAGGTNTPGNVSAFPAAGSGQITIPYSRCGIVWQNFLFWGGDGNNPSRLYFSDLGDPTIYPSANFVDVPSPFDGEAITGLAILYGNLLVFKRFSLYVLQGAPPSNLILSKLNASVGCVEPATVIQVNNLVYFVGDKGLYAANLFDVRQVCYKVEPRYTAAVPYSTPAAPIIAAHYRPRGQLFVSVNGRSLYASVSNPAYRDRILCHDYFNADANGDPACSEFIAGFTGYGLAATQPAYPTAPSLMADYLPQGNAAQSITVMASFNDQWVYTFTDGSLALGGPQDEVSWLPAPTYPPTDFLTKFYDFGDPDMTKQIRWLWTTGQIYNFLNLRAGVIYNNSPTVTPFVDFNTDLIELQSPDGSSWLIGVDDDGAPMTTKVADTTYLTTLVLQDANGVNWTIGVDNDGAFTSTRGGVSPGADPVLASSGNLAWQLTVDTDGALDPIRAFAPDVAPIVPGRRVSVAPLINGIGGAKQGKYIQLYFTGIGILTQFSMDLIMKGRRN